MDTDKYFKTPSFQLAVFLYVKGQELVGLDWVDERKAVFVFIDTPMREYWVNVYSFGRSDDPEAMADIRKVLLSSKLLKDKLYQEKREGVNN